MKNKFIPIAIIGLFLSIISFGQHAIDIIPQPVSVKLDKSSIFVYNNNTKIICNVNGKEYSVAEYLHSKLQVFNYSIKPILAKRDNPKYNMANSIIFILSSDKKLGKEGYQIDILKDRIVLSANENAGFFYGCQTLIQMIMPSNPYEEGSSKHMLTCELSTGTIIDYPRFYYRGKHLDCSRHFFTPQEIKDYIDILAFHKLNTFHWHLTDDQGWRIEIKKYPKLQTIASQRKETLIGHYSDNFPQKFDSTPYGGYYTQEEIKDIVKYAQDRYITIIPEIEMPGHALAALAAYPELSCKGGKLETACTWGVFDDVFCTKEETFTFLQDVLDEVMQLFPSTYIHIGGDECPKTLWKECPVCQKVIKNNNLKDEYELQSYFMNRIEKYLGGKGRKVIGWDEILEGGLKGNATIMSWQGEAGGIAAAKTGHDAIMTPSAYLYFNNHQGAANQEPLAIGGYMPLKKVYLYEPVPKELNDEQAKHIIGVQACTWTEYIDSYKKLQYMDLPRLSALSEIAWSQKENRNFDDFLNRLERQIERYNCLEYNYAISHYAVQASTNWNKIKQQVQVLLSSPMKDADIYYTLNGEDPTRQDIKYTNSIIIRNTTTIKARAISKSNKSFDDSPKLISPLFQQTYTLNKATGKEYKMENINPQYSGSSKYSLTDGLFGNKQSYERWVGILGQDYIVNLDLGEKTNINNISINFLDDNGSWIFAPTEVSFYISQDGTDWQKINSIGTKALVSKESIYTYKTECKQTDKKETSARYIKIEAKSIKTCPEGHPGYGYPAHCFADEIIVE